MEKVKVILADDHALVRAGIKNAIEELDYLVVVGEAKDGPTLTEVLEQDPPDLLLIDITMPDFDPIKTIHWIRTQYQQMKILVISAYDDDYYVQGLLRTGVDGYHLKDQPLVDLRLAIDRILAGEKWISSPLVDKLLSYEEKKTDVPPLTSRQRDILHLLQTAHSNQTIALELNLSVKTVENHLTRLYRLLGVQSRLEAVNYIRNHPKILMSSYSQYQTDPNLGSQAEKMAILLVDDNPRFRSQLQRMIQKFFEEGLILEAENIEEAATLVQTYDIPLAFVDVLLGDQNGLDCAKQISKFSSKTRIIMISAYPDKEFHRQSLENGADVFVDKKELDSATIRQIIDDVIAKK